MEILTGDRLNDQPITLPHSDKPKVAFICNHNSCRSQIAEALGKLLCADVFDSYSAGTIIKSQINPDAVRLVKQEYNVDMTKTQHNKTLQEIPAPDVAIFMGCNVSCPFLQAPYAENWELDDPTGQDDETFLAIMASIRDQLLRLKQKLQ